MSSSVQSHPFPQAFAARNDDSRNKTDKVKSNQDEQVLDRLTRKKIILLWPNMEKEL